NLGDDDYLIKPFSLEQLTTTVRSRLIRNRSAQSKYREYSLRMRNQLEWLLWKEKAKEINKLNMGKVMINNFRHTISQGVGDGALVTQIEMIDMCKKLDNDNYRVPVKILDSLISKAQSVRNWLESLEKTAELAEAEYAEEVISTTEISQIISESCNNVEKFRSIKNQKIVSNDPQCNKEISGNARVVGLAIRELLTNAFKFIQFVNIDIFSILIINEIEDMPLGISGIPDDCENEIFEPYHRLNHTYDERFYDEEVGMGIGLTVVRGAVNQIGGNVSIYEGMDHTDFISPTKKVIAELNFKVVTNGKH
ncbi:MAG: hypothetical protein K8R21_09245, partial [Leptospira sp.]|nr:hypothetical protein [Leptospira sp.]